MHQSVKLRYDYEVLHCLNHFVVKSHKTTENPEAMQCN